MSASPINFITALLVASLAPHNDSPPFKHVKEMDNMIDATPLGKVAWQSFTLHYDRPPPDILGSDAMDNCGLCRKSLIFTMILITRGILSPHNLQK